jgi:hypothetical protein
MRILRPGALGFLIGFWAAALAQTPEPKEIHTTGCVRKGVEGGCLMLVSLDGKTKYNIFTDKKPKEHDVIEIWGKEHNGPTTCMEGTPVAVSQWRLLPIKCPLERR